MSDETSNTNNKPTWKNRRRVIFTTLVFCALCISYVMLQGNDTRVNETIVLGCFALASSVIGFFIAGATYRDVSLEKIKAKGTRVTVPVAPLKADPKTVYTQQSNANKEPDTLPNMSSGKGLEDI